MVSKNNAIDIDNIEDFRYAEYLFKNKKKENNFFFGKKKQF